MLAANLVRSARPSLGAMSEPLSIYVKVSQSAIDRDRRRVSCGLLSPLQAAPDGHSTGDCPFCHKVEIRDIHEHSPSGRGRTRTVKRGAPGHRRRWGQHPRGLFSLWEAVWQTVPCSEAQKPVAVTAGGRWASRHDDCTTRADDSTSDGPPSDGSLATGWSTA